MSKRTGRTKNSTVRTLPLLALVLAAGLIPLLLIALAISQLPFQTAEKKPPATLQQVGLPPTQAAENVPPAIMPPAASPDASLPPTQAAEPMPPAASTVISPPPTQSEMPTQSAAPVAVTGGPGVYYLPLVSNQLPPPFIAKNVLIFIGDGMGLEHVKAGGMYAHDAPGSLSFEQFPFRGEMTTHNADMGVTDSAASATAMATGHKVNNGVISMALPGDGQNYTTLLEYASQNNMSTGLVTTTPITDATVASFAAHTSNRGNAAEIAAYYLNGSRPNVLFGGGKPELSVEMSQSSGYTVVTDRAGLLALDTESQIFVSGQFGSGYIPYEVHGLGDLPHLSEMTAAALRILDNDPDGLFLVVEGGRIDTASHSNCTGCMVGEVLEFDNAVRVGRAWAADNADTLIIVLADHETGGLEVVQSGGLGGTPSVHWTTTGHTGVRVGVFASGPFPINWPGVIDNTDIPYLLTGGEFQP